MAIERVMLMSQEEWSQYRGEEQGGLIWQELAKLFSTPMLFERLDCLINLKKLCQSSIRENRVTRRYPLEPAQCLLQRVQLFIEYILNADDSKQSKRLLEKRSYFRQYYERYVTAPPRNSPMARALRFCEERAHPNKRLSFNKLNLTCHLKDLQTGIVRQVNAEKQIEDRKNLVGRYHEIDREEYRLLPARRHRGFVQIIASGQNEKRNLVIRDYYTHQGQDIFIMTPAGEFFANTQYRTESIKYATSSLNFGRHVLFAGCIQAKGVITNITADDPHYETDRINVLLLCQHLFELGIYSRDQREATLSEYAKTHRRTPDSPFPIYRELRALYHRPERKPNESHLDEKDQIRKDLVMRDIIRRTVDFIAVQQEHFKDLIPHSVLYKCIAYAPHLAELMSIMKNPLVHDKQKEMDTFERQKAENLILFASQNTCAELDTLKALLVKVINLITDNPNAVDFLGQFLKLIANTVTTITDAKTSTEKAAHITQYVKLRDKFFQEVRQQPLPETVRDQLQELTLG